MRDVHGDIYVTLYDNDPRLTLLRHLLLAYRVDWREFGRDIFTDEELDAARLLLVTIPDECMVFGGPRLGTQFDLTNACRACATGARQTSALMLDSTDPEDVAKLETCRVVTCYQEIVVDEQLAAALVGAGVTGLSFRSVYAVRESNRQVELPRRQMWAEHALPPMSPHSIGINPRDVCASCRRGGFYFSQLSPRLAYRAQDLTGAMDVNRTWEWYGYVKFNGDLSEAVLPGPAFLVTPKVWRIFRDEGVTGFDWLPIHVVDE
ncbi:hypothetical protein [Polyangium fumosum]|uniref:Uncharacterized protein n=1 Tax=Polyangium fumosum TaxID=889272 RepID=A0A4U1IWN4_9BACT|nr:hypothetical protein [Polyangium fumosum]TKC98929.1 hypothetical protein E8A74_39740 [Polyangium fumosum]